MFQFLLDILFPPRPLTRELLGMDAGELAARAVPPQGFAGKYIISCFSYGDPLVRQAIWELKYRGNKKITALLAAALYDEILAFLEEYAPLTNFTDPLLVPIPLSRKRERRRGFNQCELLSAELMRLEGAALSPSLEGESLRGGGSTGRTFTLSLSALRKIKDTPSQTKSDSRAKRLENLRDCFSADSEAIRGRNIILIDDVATTGATLDEARRALKAAGAKKVICFTVAH